MLAEAKADVGKSSVELAATNGMPVAPVIRKPLLPRPKVVVVLNIVVMFGEVPPLEKSGLVAVTPVTPPDPEPQSLAAVERMPELFTCKHNVPPPTRFERVRPPSVRADVVAFDGNGYPNVSYAMLLAAVTNPLALTVRLLKVPMLLLTVARVKATELGPDAVPSPVSAVI